MPNLVPSMSAMVSAAWPGRPDGKVPRSTYIFSSGLSCDEFMAEKTHRLTEKISLKVVSKRGFKYWNFRVNTQFLLGLKLQGLYYMVSICWKILVCTLHMYCIGDCIGDCIVAKPPRFQLQWAAHRDTSGTGSVILPMLVGLLPC